MMKQFEHMQKLAFGETIPAIKHYDTLNESNNLKDTIKGLIHKSLGESKKKKKDVAPQEDIDIEDITNTDDSVDNQDVSQDDTPSEVDINPNIKAIQDSLNKAMANAQQLGDEKLINQIGNTITMLVRTQVVGQQQNINE